MASSRIVIQERFSLSFSIIVILLCLLFNPLYVLIFMALISKYIILPRFLNYIIAISLILSFTNRELGQGWYADGGFRAQDDSLNYISYYAELKNFGFINTFNFSDGKEPLWLALAYLTGVLTNWSKLALIFVSTAVPIILMHKSFNLLSKSFALNTLFFYSFYPEIFHTYYHLWRFSLSISILAIIVSIYISREKKYLGLLKLILPILSHLSTLLPVSWIAFITYLPKKFKRNDILYVGSLILLPLLFIILFFYFVDQINFDKFSYYVKNGVIENEFRYSYRHFIYIVISFFLIFYSRNKFTKGYVILALSILLTPAFLSFVPIIFERILLTTTPILLLLFIGDKLAKGRILYNIILLFSVVLLLRNSFILDGTLFYEFLSNGNFFRPFNGILYNIYDIF